MTNYSLQTLKPDLSILHGLRDFLKYGKTFPKRGFDAKSIMILFLFKFGLTTVYILVLETMGVEDLDHKFDDIIKDSPILFLVVGGLVAPLIEELIFRYPLTLKTKGILTAIVFSVLMMSGGFWPVMVGYMVFLVVMAVAKKMGKPVPMKWIVYISTAFFAIIHLGNYKDLDYLGFWYLMPFLVLSQFFGGLILCFIRLSHGLWMAIFFHSFWNVLLLSVGLMAEMCDVG